MGCTCLGSITIFANRIVPGQVHLALHLCPLCPGVSPTHLNPMKDAGKVLPASGTRTASPWPPSICPLPKLPPLGQLIVEPFRQCWQDMSL
jgi:hypothetical protein